jgi:hypothetical protein
MPGKADMTEGPGLGIQADVGANLVLALGAVKEQLQRQRIEQAEERHQHALDRIKNYLPLTGSVVLTAAGVGVVELGTPALGRVWTLRQIMAAVNGGELSASAPANIGWYIGANVPGTAVGTSLQITSQWRASFTAVPSVNTYTSDILQLRMGDHLFAVVNGPVGLASANMVFNAMVLDEPAKAGIPTLAQ